MTMDGTPKWLRRIWRLYNNMMPIPCLLCGSYCQTRSICDECIADLPVLPDHCCPRCARPLSLDIECGQCLYQTPEQDKSICSFAYQKPIDRLIYNFKYHHHLYLGDLFSDLIVKRLNHYPLPKLLIPIPLHSRRLKQRGYNQSLELARSLAHKLNIPVSQYQLTRSRDTTSQTSLSYELRKRNMKGAFQLNSPSLPNHVALIDDVLTTGHTANAAAKLLRQEGVSSIELWTIARTISHY